METRASRFHLQLASLEIDMNIYMRRGAACSRPWPLGPMYAEPPPVFRHWQLVLKYFRC